MRLRSLELSIPAPCHENWDAFTPTEKGGFCARCQKEVIDFTTWSDEAVLAYFTDRKKSASTCGRLMMNQLKTYTLPEPHARNIWIPAAALGATLLLNPQNGDAQTTKAQMDYQVAMKKGEVEKNIPHQDQVLRGHVFDENESPMPGVNIILKGSTLGTNTDVDGRFELTIPAANPRDTIIISFIGYVSKEISIYDQHALQIHMRLDTTQLTECVVIAGRLEAHQLTGTVGGLVAHRRYAPRSVWHRFKNLFRRQR